MWINVYNKYNINIERSEDYSSIHININNFVNIFKKSFHELTILEIWEILYQLSNMEFGWMKIVFPKEWPSKNPVGDFDLPIYIYRLPFVYKSIDKQFLCKCSLIVDQDTKSIIIKGNLENYTGYFKLNIQWLQHNNEIMVDYEGYFIEWWKPILNIKEHEEWLNNIEDICVNCLGTFLYTFSHKIKNDNNHKFVT